MINQEIANILYEIGYFLEMEERPFKPQAYEKAAIVLETLEENISDIYQKGGAKALEAIPGIGKSIAQKIAEYLETGDIQYYRSLREKIPVAIEELTQIEGIGPRTIKALYQQLGVKNLQELEQAAKEHKIAQLPGFQEKKEKNILQGINFVKKSKGRILLAEAYDIFSEIKQALLKEKRITQLNPAGSLRRKKETIGDIDILAVSCAPEETMDKFVNMPDVVKVWGQGKTKSSVRLQSGIDVDLRVLPHKNYGAALQYFTGSKAHNIALRKKAIEKKLKLSEYGLFEGKKMKAGKTEKEIYKALGMQWIYPELRENQGEIEAALENKLPAIIGYKDIKGDLHCHSNWNGGASSIKEMAQEAIKLGYQYIGIADHTKFLKIENGLDEKQLAEQRKEIQKINLQLTTNNLQLKILQGAETNILKDGRIDIKDESLKKLDYVIAGIHSHFKLGKKEMTERIIKAMNNPYIKVISHPTGRILKRRKEYQLDFDKILRAAKETETALEINAFPLRLDLNDVNIKKAKEAGVKMVINTDSHQINHLKHMELGIGQARRGWAEKKDIINAYSLDKLLQHFKKSN